MSVVIACRSKHTAPADEPLHGVATLEADLIAAISSALDAVLAHDADDRHHVLGVAVGRGCDRCPLTDPRPAALLPAAHPNGGSACRRHR